MELGHAPALLHSFGNLALRPRRGLWRRGSRATLSARQAAPAHPCSLLGRKGARAPSHPRPQRAGSGGADAQHAHDCGWSAAERGRCLLDPGRSRESEPRSALRPARRPACLRRQRTRNWGPRTGGRHEPPPRCPARRCSGRRGHRNACDPDAIRSGPRRPAGSTRRWPSARHARRGTEPTGPPACRGQPLSRPQAASADHDATFGGAHLHPRVRAGSPRRARPCGGVRHAPRDLRSACGQDSRARPW